MSIPYPLLFLIVLSIFFFVYIYHVMLIVCNILNILFCHLNQECCRLTVTHHRPSGLPSCGWSISVERSGHEVIDCDSSLLGLAHGVPPDVGACSNSRQKAPPRAPSEVRGLTSWTVWAVVQTLGRGKTDRAGWRAGGRREGAALIGWASWLVGRGLCWDCRAGSYAGRRASER
jgi:hypothetical protein